MNKRSANQETAKRAWVKPALVRPSLELDDVKAGYNTGSDGAGGINTSLPS